MTLSNRMFWRISACHFITYYNNCILTWMTYLWHLNNDIANPITISTKRSENDEYEHGVRSKSIQICKTSSFLISHFNRQTIAIDFDIFCLTHWCPIYRFYLFDTIHLRFNFEINSFLVWQYCANAVGVQVQVYYL